MPSSLLDDASIADLVDEEALERQRIARERWNAAVDDGGYTADQMHPDVRAFLASVELEPELDESGRLLGLVVTDVARDGPFARAGFRPGDVLTSLDGEILDDPAALPSLLVRLEPGAPICARRRGRRLCRSAPG